MSEQIDVALGVLDHQLLDSDDRRCGKAWTAIRPG